MPRFSQDDYQAMIARCGELVRSDPQAAVAQFRQKLARLDAIFHIVTGFCIALLMCGLYMMFGPFKESGVVLAGILAAGIGGSFVLQAFGIDPLRPDAPTQHEYIRREDFPQLFEMVDASCDRLGVPRLNHVKLRNDRFVGVVPQAVLGRKPIWALEIGVYYLLEAGAAELEWEVISSMAQSEGKLFKMYRAAYDRMTSRGVLLRYIPALAKGYWEVWALIAALKAYPETDALERAAAVGNPDWRGSMIYRAFISPYVCDIAFFDAVGHWEQESEDVPNDFCERYSALNLSRYLNSEKLAGLCLENIGEIYELKEHGFRHFLRLAGFDDQALASGAVGRLGEKLSLGGDRTAFDRYVGFGSEGAGVVLTYVRKNLSLKWRCSRRAMLFGQRVRQSKGVDPAGLTAGECLEVAYLVRGEAGSVAAGEYIEKALEVHGRDPWLIFEYFVTKSRTDIEGFPEQARKVKGVSVFNGAFKKFQHSWMAQFSHLPHDWGEPTGEFNALQNDRYTSAALPAMWQQFWISQAEKHSEISAVTACRCVDQNGMEQLFITAVLKNQSFHLRRPYFKQSVQQGFETDGVSTFSVATHDDPWVITARRNHPEVFIYGR